LARVISLGQARPFSKAIKLAAPMIFSFANSRWEIPNSARRAVLPYQSIYPRIHAPGRW
jgi:hypothetical protein